MKRKFNKWFGEFKQTIADYAYYVDFDKVCTNTTTLKVELNILNSLIGSHNIDADFEQVLQKYPDTIKCIPILLAVRGLEVSVFDNNQVINYDFDSVTLPIEQYKKFMRDTGLFDMISKHIINNLVDYVSGIEVGLDSNGRKNRGGHLMEDLVERHLAQSHMTAGKTYFKEMRASDVQQRWGVDLSRISHRGKTEKRFDFVVKTADTVYAIETNFYASGGSKLNETSRSYKTLFREAKNIKNFRFIWITDGVGWQSALAQPRRDVRHYRRHLQYCGIGKRSVRPAFRISTHFAHTNKKNSLAEYR